MLIELLSSSRSVLPRYKCCQKGSKTIEKLIKDTPRKGLGKADDPSGGDALSAWGL